MSRNAIIDKLDQELKYFPVRRESQLVYLLAEIRKVIEHEREQDPTCFEVLELFCNWALHITISRNSNADRIRMFVKAFDLKEGMEIIDFLRSSFFNEMMQLEVFRKELEIFLHDHQLPCDIARCFRTWSGFIYLYTSVVSEVPLRYSKGDLLPDEVAELVINHMPTQQPGAQRLVQWKLKLKSGEEKSAMTLYGVYRNKEKMVIGAPDFFLEEGFQL
jgi:hypothetical protein